MRLRPGAFLACLLAFAAPATSALAEACNALQVAETLTLRPFVLAAGEKISSAPGDCAAGRATFRFTGEDGRTVAAATLTAASDRTRIEFAFERAIPKASYGAEARSKAFEANLLDVHATTLREDGPRGATSYYPYAWKDAADGPVREAESVIPGYKAGGLHVVYDTNRLGAIAYTVEPGRVRALFPAYREFNRGADSASSRFDLKAGDRAGMRIFHHAGLKHIQDARFGAPDRQAIEGKAIAQFPPRFWAPNPGVIARPDFARASDQELCGQPDRGRGRPCFPTAEELTYFADGLPQGEGLALLRLALPRAQDADAIRAGGASPQFYMFFGAIGVRDADPAVPLSWRLKDSAGKDFMAPRSDRSDGNWFLLDITRKPVRDFLIGRALEALDAGFDGLFLDGGYLWNGPDGRVGGDNPGAAMSHARARHVFLRELRQAMRARKPDALMGMLANRYQEYMHIADYVIREGTSVHWLDVRQPPHLRVVAFDPRNRSAEAWQRRYGRLVASPVFFACKGPSAVLVRSCREAIAAPHAGFYYDSGDFEIFDGAVAGALLREVYGPGDLFVTRVDGDRDVEGHGVSRLAIAGADAARVWFSRPAPLVRTRDWTPLDETRHLYQFQPGETYIPPDRAGPDGWTWARQGVLMRDAETYVLGDYYHAAAPEPGADGRILATLAPSPHALVGQPTPRDPGDPGPETRMTLVVSPGLAGRIAFARLDGRPAAPTSERTSGGRIVYDFETATPIRLTVTPD